MADVEITNTTHIHNSRPFVVEAQGQCADGRHVEGVGISYLTRSRATDEAVDRAERLAEETDVSFEILNVDYRGVSISLLESEMEVRDRNGLLFPPYKVRVSAGEDGRSADGSSSSFFRFGGTVADAVEQAESQIQRMG